MQYLAGSVLIRLPYRVDHDLPLAYRQCIVAIRIPVYVSKMFIDDTWPAGSISKDLYLKGMRLHLLRYNGGRSKWKATEGSKPLYTIVP